MKISVGVGVNDIGDEFRYKGFISYSWADAKWGKWLQHAIETYHTPKILIGENKAHGPVPARLHPLFKDREEEAAGASIGAAVEAALANSAFLVVVCSPNSAKSKWVNREIAWFKTHRDPSRVFALIIDGEPGSSTEECFPKALTHKVAPDMTITDEPEDAPLAADARDSGDGKRMARLKIAAAMLGVGLDELVRRDERRRTVRNRFIVSASLALAAVMSALTWFAVEARNEADRQRAQADGLIEFMLTDLREKLEPVGRLDALDVVGERALDYYAAQKLSSLDADSLGRRSRALHLVGEVRNIRGDSESALASFREAAAATRELLARNPDDTQQIYDHAQSVFWVGYVAYERGETEAAEAEFREYKRLADRLIELEPSNPEWQMEVSYAEGNLGVMFDTQGRYAEAETAFASGLKQVEAVADAEEYSADRQIELGNFVNWLGIAKGNLGKTQEALNLHEREVSIYQRMLGRDPANASAKNRLAVAWQQVGSRQLDLGNLEAANDAYVSSLKLNTQLLAIEPNNTEWQETRAGGLYNQAEIALFAGRIGDARASLEQASNLSARLSATDITNAKWTYTFRANELRTRMRLALAERDIGLAQKNAKAALALIENQSADIGKALSSNLSRLSGDIAQRSGDREQARTLWANALELQPQTSRPSAERFILFKRLGRDTEAAELAKELDRRGFRHPAYLSER